MLKPVSAYCPKCGLANIEKGILGDWDFDSNGWFKTQQLRCKNPKCNHTWSENIAVALPGGTTFNHK